MHIFSQEQTDPKMKFPSADTLELSIDMYFNRFHNLLPLIHRPTFSIRQTPNLILFPICLMGYFLLDPKSTRDFTIVHLSVSSNHVFASCRFVNVSYLSRKLYENALMCCRGAGRRLSPLISSPCWHLALCCYVVQAL
jgi:hypothetical protein